MALRRYSSFLQSSVAATFYEIYHYLYQVLDHAWLWPLSFFIPWFCMICAPAGGATLVSMPFCKLLHRVGLKLCARRSWRRKPGPRKKVYREELHQVWRICALPPHLYQRCRAVSASLGVSRACYALNVKIQQIPVLGSSGVPPNFPFPILVLHGDPGVGFYLHLHRIPDRLVNLSFSLLFYLVCFQRCGGVLIVWVTLDVLKIIFGLEYFA